MFRYLQYRNMTLEDYSANNLIGSPNATSDFFSKHRFKYVTPYFIMCFNGTPFSYDKLLERFTRSCIPDPYLSFSVSFSQPQHLAFSVLIFPDIVNSYLTCSSQLNCHLYRSFLDQSKTPIIVSFTSLEHL